MMIRPAYAIRQAFRQILRNGAMTTASLFSITAMLIILGLFFIIIVNVNVIAENAKNQFDTIQIYLKDEMAEGAEESLMKQLEERKAVAEVVFVTRDDALERFKQRWGANGYLLEGLEKNPLPNAIEVELSDLGQAESVVESVQNDPNIEQILYSQTVVERLVTITGAIQIISLILISILIIVSIVVVANTIKLTVIAREREINIMKYIGATNWFIRGPFLVEGILIGLLSAGLAAGLMAAIYLRLAENFSHHMALLFSVGMVPQGFLVGHMAAIFVSIGVSIGAIGSTMSMRKFLDT